MKKRGIGMACMHYPIGFTSYPNPGAAFVKVHQDGTVVVSTGATDVGQGSTTALAQIVAEELGVPYEAITMVTSDTERTPFDLGSVASRVTYIVGNAVKQAAAEAKRILLEAAEEMLEAGAEDLETRDGRIYVKGYPARSVSIAEAALTATMGKGKPPMGHGSYNPETTFLDPETGQGKPYEEYVYATQIAEVEVDTETGQVTVLRLVAAHDCGKAINPMLLEGQLEGGVAMGLGYGLLEEMVLAEGEVKNPQFTDYMLPTILDVPAIELAIVEDPAPKGPFGAKGISEAALLPTAPAIINAIYDAVGVRIRDLPATPEKILAALKAQQGESLPGGTP
ncbi:MAG: nicotinate dehydrogenase medium molybdopterin subunit [Caldilineae bacterium]|nr:MAG: nicotinate dehydrogenase medium molybdopterin subunit [Caldilineae bacterium]